MSVGNAARALLHQLVLALSCMQAMGHHTSPYSWQTVPGRHCSINLQLILSLVSEVLSPPSISTGVHRPQHLECPERAAAELWNNPWSCQAGRQSLNWQRLLGCLLMAVRWVSLALGCRVRHMCRCNELHACSGRSGALQTRLLWESPGMSLMTLRHAVFLRLGFCYRWSPCWTRQLQSWARWSSPQCCPPLRLISR